MSKRKQAKQTQTYVNESVIPTREEQLSDLTVYSLFIKQDEFFSDLEELRTGRLYRRLMDALKSGRYADVKEAVEACLKDEDKPLYVRYGDSVDDALEKIQKLLERRAENFLETKEASFRSAFLPYLESVLLVGMRAKVLVNTWWRLVNYGFSVQPWDEDKPETWEKDGETYYSVSDFPYSSVSEMTKKDKEAFRQIVLDVYYVIESTCTSYHCKEKKREDVEDTSFRPYPKDGFSASELAKDWNYETEDELYESWEHEPELYLSFALFRFDEALYYAFQYAGGEYREYLSSLNVAEDWNYAFKCSNVDGYGDLTYNNVMKIK